MKNKNSLCFPNIQNFGIWDRHDIAEILLKVALNTIKQTHKQINSDNFFILDLLS
jgi:hypothetical protein